MSSRRHHYEDSLTLREGRDRYFKQNGLGPESYSQKRGTVKLGPLKIVFPSTNARREAIKIHDLHHVLTGYGTSLLEEAEIKAWELGSGGWGRHPIVIAFMIPAFAIGICLSPKALVKAFKRGRKSRNLFDQFLDEKLLSETVGSARVRLNIKS